VSASSSRSGLGKQAEQGRGSLSLRIRLANTRFREVFLQREVDKVAVLYSKHPFGDFCYGPCRERCNRPLVAFLGQLGPEGNVFDIGCGSGYWLEVALHQGAARHRLWGVDLSRVTLEALKARGVNVLQANVLDLPLADDVSAYTVCNGVIHCTPDPVCAFEELARITKPGGLIFLGVYNRWNPYFYLVHRTSAPLRFLYWHWSSKVLDIIHPLAKVFYQPLAYLSLGRFLDKRTGTTMLADQVFAPYAHLFTKRKLRHLARNCGCEVREFNYAVGFMLLTAVFKVNE